MTKKIKIFIIAGEASGDFLGAKLIAALKSINPDIEFFGIAGPKMQQEAITSLFPIEEISLFGFFEILPHLPKLIKLINYTIGSIKTIKPDLVITIDSPGFNFRIASKLQHENIKLIHYVAPSVWAYKPKRAVKVALMYDLLLALLPFEPPYFEKENLKTIFVGHPVIENVIKYKKGAFRLNYNIGNDYKIIALTPGSRAQEVKRLLPIFLGAAKLIKERIPKIVVVIIATNNLVPLIQKLTNSNEALIVSEDQKYQLLSDTDLVIAKSGTNVLEIAMFNVPFIVGYKVNFLTAMLLKLMIKIPSVNLINILGGTNIIPEFLQSYCTKESLAHAAYRLLTDSDSAKLQVEQSKKQILKLETNIKPSMKAALAVLSEIEQQNE